MASDHLPFAVLNRTVNHGVKALVRRGVAGDRLLLLTYTGRRSGREYTIPVSYVERDGGVLIQPSKPERKRWWRNLRGAGAPVRVVLRGTERTGHAVATGDAHQGVRVTVTLDA
ncbi:MAG TPA: nitroreductase/quinone reductase family protein [Solirubrobacter sp.]|nr:nitroreductase/quinone reductase family protein [Solirubrobacter sp.]